MKITEYGKIIRKARIDAGITMLDMAEALDVTSSYLSSLEMGRKRIPEKFIQRVSEFLKSLNCDIDYDKLHDSIAVSNKSIPVEGLSIEQQFLLAGFARTDMNAADIGDFQILLMKIRERNAESKRD